MKIILKFLLWAVVTVIVAVAGFLIFLQVRGIPTFATEKPSYQAVVNPTNVERGEKMASMLCNSCHKSMDGNSLTGRLMLDAPKIFGELHSANITQDKKFGIGDYTDGELLYLLRTGIKKNGKFVVIMPRFNHLSDSDINCIIAYLRSDRPMVQAKPVATVPCDYSLFSKFLCLVAFKPAEMPKQPIAAPDTNNLLQYGRYLAVDLYNCYACHSADFAKLNDEYPEKSAGFFGGGNKLLTMDGKEIKSLNITFHPTGIGGWSEEKFSRALRSGIKDGEPALRYPMEPYARLTDNEVKAIYTYLQSVPKIDNKVPRNLPL